MTGRRLRGFLFAALVFGSTIATAATSEFRVLFDVDNNTSTGCTVGTVSGVDQILVTQATNDETSAAVVKTYRLVCSGGAFGEPVDVNETGWPGTLVAPTGTMTLETRVPFTAFAQSGLPMNMRLGFTAAAGSAAQSLLTGPAGVALLFPTDAPGRRRAVGATGPQTFVLDGNLLDWATIVPLASRDLGIGDSGFQFTRAFAYANAFDDYVYFAFQARVASGSAPTANDDAYVRNQGQALVVNVPKGVLKNDVDPNGEPLTATKVSEPNHGTVTLNPDGSFQYNPTNPTAVEEDHFTYVASNATASSNTAKVSIEVNNKPKIKNGTLTVAENVPNGTVVGVADVTDEAGDSHTFTITSGNTGGAFSITALPNGDGQIVVANRTAVNFEVNPSFTLTVKVTDEGGLTDTATITITVTNQNDAPVATNSSQTVAEDQLLTVPAPGLFAQTSDEDGNTLTLSIVSNPAHGVVTLNPDGSYTYDSDPNYNGPDSFTWRAFDGVAFSNTATVSITVTPVNDTPSFTSGGNVTGTEDTPYSAPWATAISAGPADEAGQTLSFTVVAANPALFSVQPAIDASGTLTFTPAANANGSTNVDVTLVDNGGGTNSSGTQTFTITITAINDVPSFAKGADVVALDTDGLTTVSGWATALSAGPANESGQALDFLVSNDSPSLFTVAPAIAPDGTLTFTPAAGQDGIATVTVRIHDDGGTAGGGVDTSAPQTFLLTIEKIPAITSANTTTFTVGQSGTFSVTTTGRPKPDIAETGTLPAGVTFVDGSGATQGTGILSGTPAALTGGSYPITFQATNTRGSSPVQNFTLIVNEAPGITSANSATFTQGASGSFTVTTIGYPDPSLVLGGATLPTGLSFTDNGDGTATLTGTPTAAGGSYPGFTITASNGVGSNAVQNFTIIINQAPAITSANSTGFVAGTPATFTVTTTGFPAPSLGETGALPTGATFTDNGNGTATIAWNGANGSGGVYGITITATNAAGSVPQSFTITVCNQIVVGNPANATGPAGSPFSETFTQTGAVGSATFTTASTLPTGLTLSSAGVLSGTPTQGGTFPITVTVTDSNGCTGTGSTYNLVITCPTITVNNPANASGTANSPFSETFTQTGGIGTATFTLASGTLPVGLTLAPNGVLSGTPTQTGSFPITVTATDANGCTGTGSTYTIVIACQTITVNNPANANGTANSAFSETFTNSGAIGSVTYTLASGTLPAGLSLAANGTLSGTPTQTGSFPITVTATDANGCTGTGSTYTIVIACQTITVSNPANTSGSVSSPFSETFTQSGAIGTPTFTTASTLPTGLTLAANGVLSGTPTQTGSFPITVTVTDSNGCTGTSATYTLSIGCQTITVTKPVNTSGTVSAGFNETFTQSGAVGGATFTLASGVLPAGITLAAGGTLSGTPTQPGSFPITVTVTDGNGCTGTSTTYTLVIACQTITVSNPANATGPAGTPFSETFTQSGAVGGATFTTASTLPTGLTLSAAGVLSGTPTQGGTFPITVTVTDGNGCTGTGSTYNLIITCPTITVNNPANANGTANSPFSETFTQTGGIGTATFTLASGTLPAGLTLAPNGVLSGTPTQTGSFPITVTATDANGCTGTGSTYTIVIACQTITVNNPANANGTASSAFSETFTNSGAIGSVTYTLASGTLPAGLSLAANGTLSGTPTQTGSFPITVTVTDSNGCTGTGGTYTIVIACQTITVSNPANTSGTVSAPFSETFTQTGAIGTATFTTASTLPTGLTLAANGTLSGTPMQTGLFNIVVTATDSNGCTGTSSNYALVIGCQTITVTNPANTSGTVSAAFSEQFTQSGAVGSATFSTASTLPTGLTLSAAGLLAGTPTQSGTFNIVVTVTDSNGCTGSGATYSLVIGCQTITVTNPSTTTGTAGTSFTQSFTQSGAVGTPTFTTASTLPAGLVLQTDGTLTGTPTSVGSFPIVVTVTDANGCTGTGSTYTLVIGCQTITVTSPATTSVQAGSALSATFTATGILGTANWTLETGTLPSGITLNAATGELAGTTTQQGSYPITVRVTDSNGCFDISDAYTLDVTCPVITVSRTGGGSFPAATYNAVYSGQSFAGSGGTGPYTFAVTGGTFPPGLSLAANGTISGTPTATGTFTFTVTGTDASLCTGSQSFSIAVNPAPVNDSYSNLVNNTQAVVTGGSTSSPTTPFVPLTGTLIVNDLPSGGVAIVSGTSATTQGGSVTLAADGTFIYTPPVTATALATDTFTYTITSNTGGTATPTQATGTATLNLANRVWYVKNDGPNGDGRSNTPFNSTSSFVNGARVGPDKPSDIIYIYRGDGTTTNLATGVVLLDNEQLIGQGVALVVNAQTLVAAGTKPQLTNSTPGIVVTLGNGNTVRGLTITGGTDGISGNTKTAFTGGDLTLSNASANGLSLTTFAGAVTLTNTTITNNGTGVLLNGGTAVVTIDNTNSITANAGQRSVNIANLAATSSVTVGAAITDNGTGISVSSTVAGSTVSFTGTQTLSTTTNTAVNANTNAGTVTFSGTLGITTSTGTGFFASGTGTLNVLGTANVTTGAAAAALTLNGVSVGGSGITFNSVNATGPTTGISVVNVPGTVSVNGGTINNAGTGIALQGATTSLSIAGVTIGGTTTTGITNTTNFGTLTIGASVNVSAATALNLTTGIVTGTFANVSSTGGTNGVNLTSVSGTWGATAGSLTGATGATFNVSGAAAAGSAITWGGSITQNNAATAVTISGHNRNITFNGNVTTGGTSTGISIGTSSGAYLFNGTNTIAGSGGGIAIGASESGTITFSNASSINTAGTAFSIAGGGGAVTASITYGGTITKNSGGILISVDNLDSPGTLSMSHTPAAAGNITQNSNGASGITVINSSSTNITISDASVTFQNSNPGFTGSGNTGGTINLPGLALVGSGNKDGMLISGGGTINVNAGAANPSINVSTASTNAIDGTTVAFTGTLNLTNVAITGNATSDVVTLGGGTLGGTGSSITGAQRALVLSGVALTNGAGMASVTSSGGANGISLTSVTGGPYTVSAGSLTANTGSTFFVSGGSASFTYNGTMSQSAGQRIVNISGITGGTITLGGAITGTVSSTGITLAGTGGTVTISGGITLDGAADTFTASGTGLTVNVTGTNTIGATSVPAGPALSITNATIGASNVTFRSISSTGGTNGIVLNNTGSSGGLKILGNSSGNCGGSITLNSPGTPHTVGAPVTTDCTGGTIQTSTGAGISLTSTAGVVLTRMYVLNSGTDGITANTITGLTVDHCYITDSAGAAQDRGIEIGDFSTGTAVNGTISIQNSTVGPTPHDNLGIGIGSGTSTWSIANSVFTGSVQNSGINFEIRNATVTSWNLNNCVIKNQFADGMQMQPSASSTGTITDAVIQNTTFQGNNLGLDLNHDGTASVTYRVLNNTFRTQQSHAINLFTSAVQAPTTGGTLNTRFEGNFIGTAGTPGSGSAIGNGIRININGGAHANVLLNNNIIRQTPNGRGVEAISRNGTGGMDLTLSGNDVNPQDTSGFPLAALFVQSNCVGVCNSLRADIRGNTVPAGATTDLNSTYIAFLETSGAPSPPGTSTAQLVDNSPASGTATIELTEAHTNPANNNTGSASASAGVALIAGPIVTPP